MAKNQKKRFRIDKIWPIGLNEEQHIIVAQKGIKPEHIRHFIDNFEQRNGLKRIDSGDWRELRSILERVPSLQLVGDVGSGKTHLARSLIENDKDHIYIVLDAHEEFTHLPEEHQILPSITKNCRIKLPEQPAGAVGMFKVYYNLIMNNAFPANFVLVVEEAMRYKDTGIKNLLAEARKFIKVLTLNQELLVDFVPHITVKPYNQYRV